MTTQYTLTFYGQDESGTAKKLVGKNVRYPSLERAREAAHLALQQIAEVWVVHIVRVGGDGNAVAVVKRG